MKKYFLLAFLLLTVGGVRVAAQNVDVNFDKNANFLQYQTYKWVTIKDGLQLDDLTADQLRATVDVELAKKGLKKSNANETDLLVAYQMARPGQKQLSHFNVGASYGSSAGATSATAGAATTTVHSGQLVLDLYEAAKQKLIWRGVVSDAIDADAKPAKKQKHMDKAIEKLLKNYPPEKK
jgi:Domain of unknown function (DUF4136)